MSLWSAGGCSGLAWAHSCVWGQLQVGEVALLILAGLCHVPGLQLEQLDSALPDLSFFIRPTGSCARGDVRVPEEWAEPCLASEAYAWNWPIIPSLHSSGSSWPQGQWVGKQIPLLMGGTAESLCKVTTVWQTRGGMESCGHFCNLPHLGSHLTSLRRSFLICKTGIILPRSELLWRFDAKCIVVLVNNSYFYSLIILLFNISQWLHFTQWMKLEFLSATNKAFVIWTLPACPSLLQWLWTT